MFTPSATELTTAATDAAMALLCAVLLARLAGVRSRSTWQVAVWAWVFRLLLIGSLLGAIAHGLRGAAIFASALWPVLYLSLGLAVALFLVGATAASHGDEAGRRLLPWALGAGAVFVAISQLLGGAFLIFTVYEAAAMIAALAIYGGLAVRRRPGALAVTAGIALTLAAAGVQATSLRLDVIVPFDHNGLFHLVQMIATVVIAIGVRQQLEHV